MAEWLYGDKRNPVVPEISDERLAELSKRITPVLLQDGKLVSIKNVHPRKESFTWSENETEECEDLIDLIDISTDHTCSYYGFFKPSIAEVLAQIPEEYLDYVVAFKTKFQAIYGSGNGHLGLTTLYGSSKESAQKFRGGRLHVTDLLNGKVEQDKGVGPSTEPCFPCGSTHTIQTTVLHEIPFITIFDFRTIHITVPGQRCLDCGETFPTEDIGDIVERYVREARDDHNGKMMQQTRERLQQTIGMSREEWCEILGIGKDKLNALENGEEQVDSTMSSLIHALCTRETAENLLNRVRRINRSKKEWDERHS